MNYPIKGFNPSTFIDWDGSIASVIYLAGCNFRCPYCHSSKLTGPGDAIDDVPLDRIIEFLEGKKGWIDGVIVAGGEPTMYSRLPELLTRLRQLPLKLKLDTNGSFPEMLSELIQRDLIDYVAMDVKAPLVNDKYQRISGSDIDVARISASIDLLLSKDLDYEFRTTVVPMLERNDILAISQRIAGARRYILQQFDPRDTLDPDLGSLKPYPPEELKLLASMCAEFVQQTSVRGA